jgi:hypothetical protein
LKATSLSLVKFVTVTDAGEKLWNEIPGSFSSSGEGQPIRVKKSPITNKSDTNFVIVFIVLPQTVFTTANARKLHVTNIGPAELPAH